MTTNTPTRPHALQELKAGQQWVCFNEKKIPYNASNGRAAASDNSETWQSYDRARKVWIANSGFYAGIGRMFLREQGITGVDLDKCINPDGTIAEWALTIVKLLNSYTEYSPSGRGLHIWVHGVIPQNLAPNKPQPDGIEMYDHLRYFTFTGKHLSETPTTIEDRQAQLLDLYQEVTTRREQAKRQAEETNRGKARKSEAIRAIGGDSPYGLVALDRECNDLRRTADGARNDQLNRSAYALGQLVAGGELTRNTAEMQLFAAAATAGLDEREIEKTMRSGIEKGMQSPRSAPVIPAHNGHREPPNDIRPEEPTQGQKPFNRTDFGNAERLVIRHGQNMRYCHAMNNWLIWTGTHWQEDKNGQAERLAKETVRSIYAEAARSEEEQERKALAVHGLKSESKARIRDMLVLAQSEPGIPAAREDLDPNTWLLNCANGTIDLESGRFFSARREDLITRCLKTAYNPDAICPTWLSFLDTIFAGNIELIAYMQRALGYALTGDVSEQCFFLLTGKGHNGKSTLLEVIQAILQDYAQSAEFRAFLARDKDGIRNDIARMNGKRMIIAKESDKGARLAEAMIKQLTGDDTISARFLHQEYFDFKPQFKIFLAANHLPEIRGTDLGIWRRVRRIPFEVTIPETQKDKHLSKKLLQEAEGILAWLVQGSLAWQREGLGMPEAVKKATTAYQDEMDQVARFVEECCENDPSGNVGASVLFKAYTQWCDETNERAEKQTTFGTRLTERGYEKKKERTGVVYYGLKLQSVNSVNSVHGLSNFSRVDEDSRPKHEKTLHNCSHCSQEPEKMGNLSLLSPAQALLSEIEGQGCSLRIREDGAFGIGVPETWTDEQYEALATRIYAQGDELRALLSGGQVNV